MLPAPAPLALQEGLAVCWAPLPLSMTRQEPGRLLLQDGLAAQYRRLRGRGEPAGPALMLISDVLGACLPPLRRLAQQNLLQTAPPEPEALLRAGRRAHAEARQRLERTMPALSEALQRGGELPPPPAGNPPRGSAPPRPFTGAGTAGEGLSPSHSPRGQRRRAKPLAKPKDQTVLK